MNTTPTQAVTVSDLIPELDAAPPPATPPVTDQEPPTATESHADNVERDSAGVPFDPARHLPKRHPKTGRWIPRGGRKPKRAPGSPASSSPSTSSPLPASSGDFRTSPPADLPPVPEVGPEAGDNDDPDTSAGTRADAATAAPAGPARDAELSPKAAGELAARALYKVTGALSGDHKRAVAKGAEHESIKQTAAAYFEFRGLKLVGALALVATGVAYLLTDDRADGIGKRVIDWIAKRRAAKRAPASSAVIDIEPAAASAPGKAAKQPPPPVSPFAGHGL